MDPAQELELAVLARQKPIMEAIAQGGSSVQQFYNDATVFVTGGTGFLGKQLIEKLLRSCNIRKIYMLLRQKKEKNIQQRVAAMLNDPVYDNLREKQPNFASKIVPVEGDVAEIRLGLSDKDWAMLTEEVNVIFHVAATIRFDEPIKKATIINVRGTREALAFGKECKNFKCFNYTSTAFTHTTRSRINTDIEEKFYPCPVPPDVLIEIVENVDEARLDAITPGLIDEWPNTYTFTKALAEELIRTTAGDLPVCIVKPPVVLNALIEPAPGWIDVNAAMSTICGGILGVGLGVLHVMLLKRDNIVSYAPVDYVNNAIIAASWDSVERKKNGEDDIAIYTVSTSGCRIQNKFFGDMLRSDEFVRLVSPKTVWYCYGLDTSSNLVFWILTWLLHYIPGYLADGLLDLFGARPKGIPRLVNIYTKIYKLTLALQYFMFNYWNIKDDRLKGMIDRLSPQDRTIFNCDVKTIDFKEQMKIMCIGTRKFILKDELKGTMAAYKKQKYFYKYANILFFAAYGYLIYAVLYFVYFFISSVLQIVF